MDENLRINKVHFFFLFGGVEDFFQKNKGKIDKRMNGAFSISNQSFLSNFALSFGFFFFFNVTMPREETLHQHDVGNYLGMHVLGFGFRNYILV